MRKRPFGWVCISALALLSLGVVAFAQEANPQPQQPRRAGGGQNRQLSLVQNQLPLLPLDVMKSYLQLTEEQVGKIKPLQEKARTAMKDLQEGIRPQNGQQPDRTKLREATTKFREAVASSHKEIEAVLTEEQKKKVPDMEKEIQLLNSVGLPPATLADLKLTEEQKKKLRTLSEETQVKRAALTQEERRSPKGREITQEARQKAMETLTAEQKAIVEKWRKENPPQRQANRPPPPAP
jgi:hypothetical protein